MIQQPEKFDSYVLSNTFHGLHDVAFVSSDYIVSLNNVLTLPVEPCYYAQAKHDPIYAMDTEIKALKANNIWELIPLPKDKHAICCKWVFKTKFNSYGSVDDVKLGWWLEL